MGSSSSTARQKRVTFGDDQHEEIVEEYADRPYSRVGGPQSNRGPPTTTTIERTFTDQDSFELGDPRASRSRESTFSLGQHIKKRAEDDERVVDRIIQEHVASRPETVVHKTTIDRRDPSPRRVVTKTVTERELFDGSTSSDGLRINRRLQTIDERPMKPTMTEHLWTSGRRHYEENDDKWTTHNDRTRLELTTHGRSTLHANNGVKVLSGEVMNAIEPMHVVEDPIEEHRSHRYRVVKTHRDTADPLPSVRHYRVRRRGVSGSLASSTSSLHSERARSDPGQRHSRYSRYYTDDRSPRYHRSDDDGVVEHVVIHRHVRTPRVPEPEVVKVTRHHVHRSPGDRREIAYGDNRSEDDDDSGYRGQSPRRRRDDYDEKDYRRATSARRPHERTIITRHVYE